MAFRLVIMIFVLLVVGWWQVSSKVFDESHSNYSKTSVKMVILMPAEASQIGYPSALTSGGAAVLALEKAEKEGLLSNVNVSLMWKDTECSESEALGESVDLQLRHQVDVFIGPACHRALKAVSLLASYWKIPIISWFPIETNLTTRSGHSRLINFYGSYSEISDAIYGVLQHLSWSKLGILSFADNFICKSLTDAVKHELSERGIVLLSSIVLRDDTGATIREGFETLRSRARIIFLCLSSSRLLPVLQEASRAGIGSGDYVMLYFNFGSHPVQPPPGKGGGVDNIWLSVLQIGTFSSEEESHTTFSEQVKNCTSLSPFFLEPNKNWVMDEYAEYLYDAVLGYLYAVSTDKGARSQNISYKPSVSEEIRRNIYQGKTGNVSLTSTGVRKPEYQVLHYQHGELHTVGTVSSDYFQATDIKVKWLGSGTPKDSPKCGFQMNLCAKQQGLPIHSAVIIGSVLTTAMVTGLLLTCLIYRRLHYERSLVRMTWSIDERDLKLRSTAVSMLSSPTSGRHVPAEKRLSRSDTRGTLGFGSSCSLDRSQQLFTVIGYYRGSVVAIKRFKSKVDLTRDVLKDFKALKELRHENLNAFIGAKITPRDSLILTEYCSKGSLQDVLENDDVKLDMTFKMSFSMDIARGMTYLHRCPIRLHGNLKSTNCILGSRWVVKVTDFGVITEPLTTRPENMGAHQYYSRKLWTASELLRLEAPPSKGTQSGDVYSFGIILSEIMLRAGPFYYNHSTPEDIVDQVKNISGSPYRPVIPDANDVTASLRSLMTSCWDECPSERPVFGDIKKRLMDINGGKKTNMLENMLKMLESHTNNLEELVSQRTAQLEQEKMRTDRLLYQMLPKSVANQLKSGEVVHPESYEEATIFFSDIVGFTEISSNSTPLEVVDLLNDLYTTFDKVIPNHDVYKVETIGDAYMCVSGVPNKNGHRHVVEIANMALELLDDVIGFEIRHMPGEKLQLRIGLHTGPCVAGVVGLAMPRYCLFGDTVNMASRMESTGQGLSIHISDAANDALRQMDAGFITVRRGWIDVKGKGPVMTHWLTGRHAQTDGIGRPVHSPAPDVLVGVTEVKESM